MKPCRHYMNILVKEGKLYRYILVLSLKLDLFDLRLQFPSTWSADLAIRNCEITEHWLRVRKIAKSGMFDHFARMEICRRASYYQ